jgi:hypothetical protein
MPTLSFRVSPEEGGETRDAARRARRSVSAHLRAAVLGKKAPPAKYRSGKHPVSGLPCNAAGKGLPPVSLNDIKESLADFP